MQVTDELVRSVVQEVLSQMRNGQARPSNGHAQRWGIFADVDEAVRILDDSFAAFKV